MRGLPRSQRALFRAIRIEAVQEERESSVSEDDEVKILGWGDGTDLMHDIILLVIGFIVGLPAGVELNRWRVRRKYMARIAQAAARLSRDRFWPPAKREPPPSPDPPPQR
jgi:hypothetical protein